MPRFLKQQHHEYSLLETSYVNFSFTSWAVLFTKLGSARSAPLILGLLWLLSIFLAALVGHVKGFEARCTSPFGDLVQAIGSKQQAYQYNVTFASAPSADTDHAWSELFPSQGGFFRHPTLATNRHGLAVFHQLHCLNGIRHGYWDLVNSTQKPVNTQPTGGKGADKDKMRMNMLSAPHIRHCIDYLRQSLMCHADTNVEPVETDANGVKGFGVKHQCRDYSMVKDWVSEWETFGSEHKADGVYI